MKKTFKERIQNAGKGMLISLLCIVSVLLFVVASYVLPFLVISKEAAKSDAIPAVGFGAFLVILLTIVPMANKTTPLKKKGELIAVGIILLVFGFLPNIIISPKYINTGFKIEAVAAFAFLFFPAVLSMTYYIYIRKGMDKIWIILLTPMAAVAVSFGLMALLCSIKGIAAFLVAVLSYPAIFAAMFIIMKKNGSILRTNDHSYYPSIQSEPERTTSPSPRPQQTTSPSPSSRSEDAIDTYQLGSIVKNCCSEYAFGFPTKGYLRYKDNYIKRIRQDEFEIVVYVYADCYKNAQKSDVEKGIDDFGNIVFDKLEKRLDRYNISYDFNVKIDDVRIID